MKKILFFGEIPEVAMHGISISNKINLDFLSKRFLIDSVIDAKPIMSDRSSSFFKLINTLTSVFRVSFLSLFNRYYYFYSVFSFSFFGSLKTLSVLLANTIFCPFSVRVIHVHRGDFTVFYKRSFFHKVISKLVFFFCDKIIILSDLQVRDFSKFKKTKDIFILPNTIEKEYLYLDKSFSSDLKFIYLSNYILEKGVLDVLEAFETMKNEKISLDCFGCFSTHEFKDKVLSFASSSISINESINEKMKKLLEYDCLILPSWNEGQPLVLLEAMSLGLPIIATSVGLVPEMLGPDYPFIYLPRDKVQLNDKIKKFIDYKHKRELSSYLRKRYFERYSQKHHKTELDRIFI